MIRTWLLLGCVAVAAILVWKAWLAWRWHHRGDGARKARNEYARIRREQPDTAEARLTEAEFVRYFVALRPGPARYAVAAALLLLASLPAAHLLASGWPWE